MPVMARTPVATLVPPLTPADAQAVGAFAHRVRDTLGNQLVGMRLFGSKARGDADQDSDIDVLVVVAPRFSVKELQRVVVDLAFDVNLAHDVYISPRVVGEDALTDPVQLRGSFLGLALREGIRL